MINVYTIGHGFLLNVEKTPFITPVPLTFYVNEQDLYDGYLSKKLIEEGKFEPPNRPQRPRIAFGIFIAGM